MESVLQYLLTKDTLLEATYHGSKSRHLMSLLDNETNPHSRLSLRF
jgi:hypothetical protein